MRRLPGILSVWLVLGFLIGAASAWAAEDRQEDPAEALARKIAKELRCAVCQNQSVYDSNSDLAKDMLRIIREKVKAGVGEAEIRDFFFQRYGDYIYLEPTKKGSNLMLWLGPFAGLSVGGVLLWLAVRRWRSGPPGAEQEDPRIPPQEAAEIQREIQEELDKIKV